MRCKFSTDNMLTSFVTDFEFCFPLCKLSTCCMLSSICSHQFSIYVNSRPKDIWDSVAMRKFLRFILYYLLTSESEHTDIVAHWSWLLSMPLFFFFLVFGSLSCHMSFLPLQMCFHQSRREYDSCKFLSVRVPLWFHNFKA